MTLMGGLPSKVRGYFSGGEESNVAQPSDDLDRDETMPPLSAAAAASSSIPAGIDPNEIAWLSDVYVQDGMGMLTPLDFKPDPAPVLLAGSDYPTVHILEDHQSAFHGARGKHSVVL